MGGGVWVFEGGFWEGVIWGSGSEGFDLSPEPVDHPAFEKETDCRNNNSKRALAQLISATRRMQQNLSIPPQRECASFPARTRQLPTNPQKPLVVR